MAVPPGEMEQPKRNTLGLQLRAARLVKGFGYSLWLYELFALLCTIIGYLFNWLTYYNEDDEENPKLMSGLHYYASFMISPTNFAMILCLMIATYVHGRHATAYCKTPVKRYQLLLQYLSLSSILHTFLIGFSCALFAQSFSATIGIPIVIGDQCNKMENISSQYINMTCVNEKNFFALFAVMMLTMLEFVLWRKNRVYVLKFYHLEKSFSQHIMLYLKTNWKVPLKRAVFGFVMLLMIYQVAIRNTFLFSVYFWRKVAFAEGAMNSWFDALELTCILKTVFCIYVGVGFFICQWEYINYLLVQPPHLPVHLSYPNPVIILNRYAITSSDPYAQSLGWLDLMSISRLNSPEMKGLFALSHPGNRPFVWNITLEQCIKLGHELLQSISLYNASYNEHMSREAVRKLAAGEIKAFHIQEGRVQIFRHVPPQFPDLQDIRSRARSSKNIGRPLSSTSPPRSPVANVTRASFLETILMAPVLMHRTIKNKVLSGLARFVPKVRGKNLWEHWTEEDIDLKFANVLSESLIYTWAMTGIVDSISCSITGEANAILHRDIPRINELFIDIFDAVKLLGESIPRLVDYHLIGAHNIVKYGKSKEDYKALTKSIQFLVSKYYHHTSPYFSALSIAPSIRVKFETMKRGIKT